MGKLEEYILEANAQEDDPKTGKLFRKKRGNIHLTRKQVKAIKKGRKLLRKDMRAQGLKRKADFELAASSVGLYFDKGWLAALLLLLGRWWPWMLGASAALALAAMALLSVVTEMRGHFTINMSDELFREGFVLSETADFRNPTTYLFATPAENVPCISINDIPVDVDEYEGTHNEQYFAYTFFLRNEGQSTVDYVWSMELNSESKSLSDAVWVMIFEDGKMCFYAEPNSGGKTEALPAFGDDTRGYVNPELMALCRNPEEQYDLIRERGDLRYYRIVPVDFLSQTHVAEGGQTMVAPSDVHQYTIVIWLEGDDPDCTNAMIGGHVGMEFNIELTQVHNGET